MVYQTFENYYLNFDTYSNYLESKLCKNFSIFKLWLWTPILVSPMLTTVDILRNAWRLYYSAHLAKKFQYIIIRTSLLWMSHSFGTLPLIHFGRFLFYVTPSLTFEVSKNAVDHIAVRNIKPALVKMTSDFCWCGRFYSINTNAAMRLARATSRSDISPWQNTWYLLDV